MNLVSALDVDIMAISETRLSPNVSLATPGYALYRQDKHSSGRGQGVALLVRQNIVHSYFHMPITQHLEVTGIKMLISGREHIFVSAYQSPNLPLFTDDIDAVLKLSQRVLIMGDLNANHDLWIPGIKNSHGNKLFNHMLSSDFSIHASNTPTLLHYRPNLTATNPNLVITQNIKNLSEIKALNCLSSNHLPLFFTMGGQPHLKPPVSSYRYNEGNWQKYRSHLNKIISLDSSTFQSHEQVDSNLALFNSHLLEARDLSVPLVIKPDKKCIPLPWYIRKKIKIRNRLRRDLHAATDPISKKEIRSEMNCLQKVIKMKIQKFMDAVWNKKLAQVDNPSSDIWRLIKSLKMETATTPPLMKSDGTLTRTTLEQCEVLAETFKSNMQLTHDWHNPNLASTVQTSIETLGEYTDVSLTPPLIRPHEVWSLIRKLKRRKAPGEDNIHNALIKNLPQKAVVYLTKIFNGCFRLNYFPNVWKSAKVIAIKKPNKDDKMPISYRPISLLPVLAKLFEAAIHTRLLRSASHVIPDEQFGFRRAHSTSHQLVRVAEHISHNLNLRRSTGMVLLDIEKAFDTVWHEGLLHKLLTLSIPIELVKLVQSYLTNRTFKVFLDDSYSQPRNIPAGVPQGSILGPFLFTLYVHDIPKQPRTSLACFADDTASFTSSTDEDLIISRLQLSLDGLKAYFQDWKLKLNDAKTEAIMFSRKQRAPARTIRIGGHCIPWRDTVKYLGITFDKKLNWTQHVANVKIKSVAVMIGLNPIFNRHSLLSSSTKLRIYTTLIRPCLTYACPAWNTTCPTNHKSLQVIQNKALKIAYNTPFRTNLHRLHEQINLDLLFNFILKLTR